MAKRARKDDEEDRPRRYRIALEEIRHELLELWAVRLMTEATSSREECRQLMGG